MIDEMDLKPIPYGIADFNEIRENDNYYVDKTLYIRHIEKKGRYLFFIRPRRFGKSLFLSTIEAYYDIARRDEFDYFFSGTAIHQNPTREKSKYVVLKLNFSRINASFDEVQESFLNNIKNSLTFFINKYGPLMAIDIPQTLANLNTKKNAADMMDTFLYICQSAKQKLYVIIDEYDNFANTILSASGEQAYLDITGGEGFLRSFFNVVKGGTSDTNAPISRLFMTGVSPLTLDDVTSGFNIAENISLDTDLNEILGFNRSEVETMIEYYRQTGKIRHSTPELLEIMSRWYNHYRFSLNATAEVFNSVHVLYFIKQYLKDSQVPAIMVDENVRMDYQKLRHLVIIDKQGTPSTNGNFSRLRDIIETGTVSARIGRSFSIKKLLEPGNFISLLYFFGLLTIAGADEENKAILKIPNESIKRLYYDYIKETYEETGIFSIDFTRYEALMKAMAFNGEWEPLLVYLEGEMEKSMKLRDLMGGEKTIQAFLNVYLGLSNLYIISSEKELKKGYADLVLEPFLAQFPTIKYAYLIEIKYIKPTEYAQEKGTDKVQALRTAAETQLARYSLDESFQKAMGPTTLKKVVLIFCGHRLLDHYEI